MQLRMSSISLLLLLVIASHGRDVRAEQEGPLKAAADERVVYVPKGRSFVRRRNFVKVWYELKRPTEGYFNINGKAVRLQITSSDPELLQIAMAGEKHLWFNSETTHSEDMYYFHKPGKVAITVKVGDQSKTGSIEIVELPFEHGVSPISSRQLIEIMGLPDEEKRHFVSWPDTEIIEGIIYSPSASTSIVSPEHWRYKDYPGLVISIEDGKVFGIGTHPIRVKKEKAKDTASYRTWHSKEGETLGVGKFIKYAKGKVHIQQSDDKTFELSLVKLSKDEQKWVRTEWKKRKKKLDAADR